MAKLLLVEDDEVFAQVMQRALSQRNFDTAHAHDRDSALQRVGDTRFDFAILDLNLGTDTSLGLIPRLRESNPEMRILILTGYASITTAVDAIKLGANNYLAKPADIEEILAALLEEDTVETDGSLPAEGLEPMSVRRLEWEHIQKVLKENDGNISATARQLKMHRRTLQRKLQKRPVAR